MAKNSFFITTCLIFIALVATGSQAQTPSIAEVPEMVLIPSGPFWMGRTHMFLFDELSWTARARLDDQPAHRISIDAFYIDKYEVTNADYALFVQATGRRTPWHWAKGQITPGQERWPAYNVDWNDAASFCAWAGKRLPTEAEWEKAARGGLDRNLYSWGNEIGETNGSAGEEGGGARQTKLARYGFPNGPAPVGSYKPNGYGLYDVTGNVWEWVSDWYTRDYYVISPLNNPGGPEDGTYKVIRGGGWSNEDDQRTGQRSLLGVHYRNYAPPSQTSDAFGFRCARSVERSPNPE